jgi:hypothetical protein
MRWPLNNIFHISLVLLVVLSSPSTTIADQIKLSLPGDTQTRGSPMTISCGQCRTIRACPGLFVIHWNILKGYAYSHGNYAAQNTRISSNPAWRSEKEDWAGASFDHATLRGNAIAVSYFVM